MQAQLFPVLVNLLQAAMANIKRSNVGNHK